MQRPFEVPEHLYPFESRWCLVGGVPVHYVDEGRGPVLLLLHGNFMWSFAYRALIQALRDDFRCIAIDLPGMGMSGKPHQLGHDDDAYTLRAQSAAVESVIDELELDELTLLSYDHGGPIGFGLATRRPERVARIVISNSWAWSAHPYLQSRLWSSMAPRVPGLLSRLLRDKKRWLFESRSALREPGVWEACVAPYRSADDYRPIVRLAEQLTGARDYFAEIGERLPALADKPIEIVWASRASRLFPEYVAETQYLRRWQSIFPQARTTKLERTGYYFLSSPPTALLQALRTLPR